ncbi:type I glutamate--ammonia ligase [Deferribacterales bacterium RsTz2092]|nr:glutamine synthetase [Deferribacterales bacterium]
MTVQEIMALLKKDVRMVDIRFTDMLGAWQHSVVPAAEFPEDVFKDGVAFDGSSIQGWKSIDSSDMLIIPDPNTAFLDPFTELPTIVISCDVFDPITGAPYDRSPRYIAQKALAYLKSTGIADECFVGPELEFFIFDNVQYQVAPQSTFYALDANEAGWNTRRYEDGKNTGYKVEAKAGYYPVSPNDALYNLRAEMAVTLEKSGISVECHHHEVAVAQHEIDIKFRPLLEQADNVLKYKYIVRNVALKHGKSVTFMPKPLFGDNGSGMHTHMSLWKAGKPLFAGSAYAGLSETALYYIGGVLKHAKAVAAFSNPSLNSYRRLVPGFEAPVNLAYSARNRSASIRIPMNSKNPKAKRVEVRFPDTTANPYLSFTALLLAGLDGVLNKIDPGAAMDKNLYDLDPIELANVPQMPGSLDEALHALENDHAFLLKGDTFTEDFINAWINLKVDGEIKPSRLLPSPFEFQKYYGY